MQSPWLSTWLPLFSIAQPLASPWVPFAGSQREAKDQKLMKIVSKLNIFTTEHVSLSVKKLVLTLKLLATWLPLFSIVQPWVPLGFPLSEANEKPRI